MSRYECINVEAQGVVLWVTLNRAAALNSISSPLVADFSALLDAFGIHYIEGGWPGSNPKDKEFFARAGELVSRDTMQAQRLELWLDFQQCGVAEREARLSRLAAWVLQADRLGVDYGLRLPAQQIRPAGGEAHRRRCLEALALC